MRSIVIDSNDEQLHTLAQRRTFVDGTVAVEFAVAVEERYGFIAHTVGAAWWYREYAKEQA